MNARTATRRRAGSMSPRHVRDLEELAATVGQRVAGQGSLREEMDRFPDPNGIWSSDRPESGFGNGGEPPWSHIGDGIATTFAIPGRIATYPARYRVTVGGVLQPPTTYSISTTSETISFGEPPAIGLRIRIVAPFYGAAP